MEFNRFDIVEAYYLFFSLYHEGQTSKKYQRMSKMLSYYKPSPTLKYHTLSDNAQYIYNNLLAKFVKGEA